MKAKELEARQVKRGDVVEDGGRWLKVLEVRPPGKTGHMSWPHLGLLVADKENWRADGKTLLSFMPKDKVRVRR